MKKGITPSFSVNLGGFQARDTLYEEIDIVVDVFKAFIERSATKKISKDWSLRCR